MKHVFVDGEIARKTVTVIYLEGIYESMVPVQYYFSYLLEFAIRCVTIEIDKILRFRLCFST